MSCSVVMQKEYFHGFWVRCVTMINIIKYYNFFNKHYYNIFNKYHAILRKILLLLLLYILRKYDLF
jgi:hypothetical protein